MPALLPEWSGNAKPIIGMLHLPPLPGSPGFSSDSDSIVTRLLSDAQALVDGGVCGLLMENFGDAPFCPRRVPAHVVAHMTHLAGEVRRRFDLPLGINVLRNDGLSALSVAQATGAALIRVNVLCGARLTDQGILEGIAHELLREREMLNARNIRILADVEVKHSTALGVARPLEEEVQDTIQRGRADAVVVSGSGTGQATSLETIRRAKSAAGDTPVFVGSGITAENVAAQLDAADGAIVGTGFKKDGQARNPVDPDRVRAIMREVS